MKKFSFLLALSFLVAPSFANERNFYSINQQYIGVRPMAMGGAFSAVGGDYNTLFYNPAGLYDIEDKSLVVNLLTYGASTGDNSIADLYKDLRSASSQSGSARTTELTRLVESKYGNYYHARLNTLSFHYTKPQSGFAFIPLDGSLSLKLDKQIGPTIKAEVTEHTTLAYGHAWSMDSVTPGLRVGVTGKATYHAYFARVVPLIDYEQNKDVVKSDYAQEGVSLDADLGFLHHKDFDSGSRLSSAVVFRNFFNTGYKQDLHLINDNSSNPPDAQTRIDLGVNYQLYKLWRFKPSFAFDLRDIGHENANLMKTIHAGTEWKIDMGEHFHPSLMMGLNQGYLTAGVSLQTLWYLLEFATYGEEVGTKDGKKENRVNMFKFALYF